jgi:hypothetical protein
VGPDPERSSARADGPDFPRAPCAGARFPPGGPWDRGPRARCAVRRPAEIARYSPGPQRTPTLFLQCVSQTHPVYTVLIPQRFRGLSGRRARSRGALGAVRCAPPRRAPALARCTLPAGALHVQAMCRQCATIGPPPHPVPAAHGLPVTCARLAGACAGSSPAISGQRNLDLLVHRGSAQAFEVQRARCVTPRPNSTKGAP